MTKYFNPKGQNANGVWRKKKSRLPRKMKKWVKQFDLIHLRRNKSKYLTPISVYKHLLEFRAHRRYVVGQMYYKQVFKYY